MRDYNKLYEDGKSALEQQFPENDDVYIDEEDGYDEEEIEEISYEDNEDETTLEESNIEIPKNSPENFEGLPKVDSDYNEEDEPPKVDPYDAPLFPGGPNKSLVETWKRKWEDSNLRVVEIQEQFFVFRTLNRFEYKQITGYNIDALAREEVICETCTLWPQDYDHKSMALGNAGLPSTFAQIIMEESGFTNKYNISVL